MLICASIMVLEFLFLSNTHNNLRKRFARDRCIAVNDVRIEAGGFAREVTERLFLNPMRFWSLLKKKL